MQSQAGVTVSEWALLFEQLPNLRDDATPREPFGHIGLAFLGRPSDVEGARAYAAAGHERKGFDWLNRVKIGTGIGRDRILARLSRGARCDAAAPTAARSGRVVGLLRLPNPPMTVGGC